MYKNASSGMNVGFDPENSMEDESWYFEPVSIFPILVSWVSCSLSPVLVYRPNGLGAGQIYPVIHRINTAVFELDKYLIVDKQMVGVTKIKDRERTRPNGIVWNISQAGTMSP